MTDTTDPSVLEMENSPETANYRKSRLMLLEALRAAYLDYIADATKHGATPTQAEEAAGKSVRGEVRALCSELLTRTPPGAITPFMRDAPNWVDDSEKLLTNEKQATALVELIQSAYPHRTWATKMDAITLAVAKDEASWAGWVKAWGEEFAAAGETIGAGVSGAANLLSGLGEGAATLLRWSPYILGGATLLGVVTVIAVAARE